MIIKILEYQYWRGNKVKVQSHNKRNGRWKINPWFEFHQKVANNEYFIIGKCLWKKEYEKELI